MEISLVEQWERSGFNTIELPLRVVVYGVVAKYVTNEEVVPTSDLDNQYTTIQEMLQNGVIIEDDRQIKSFLCEEKLVTKRENQYARCWLWVDNNLPVMHQYNQFHEHRKNNFLQTVPTLLSIALGEDL